MYLFPDTRTCTYIRTNLHYLQFQTAGFRLQIHVLITAHIQYINEVDIIQEKVFNISLRPNKKE